MNEEKYIKEKLDENLSEESKEDLKKMRAHHLVKLSKITTRIYSNMCDGCKQRVISNPDAVKNIDDFCNTCQENPEIILLFEKLQKLYGDING